MVSRQYGRRYLRQLQQAGKEVRCSASVNEGIHPLGGRQQQTHGVFLWSDPFSVQSRTLHSLSSIQHTRERRRSRGGKTSTTMKQSVSPDRKRNNKSAEDRLASIPIGSMTVSQASYWHWYIHNRQATVGMDSHGAPKVGEQDGSGKQGFESEHPAMLERILERLVLELLSGNTAAIDTRLLSKSYDGVMRAWARWLGTLKDEASDNTALPVAVDRANVLLERMKARYRKSPTLHPAPGVHSYDSVLFACARASKRLPENKAVAALAEDLVKTLENSAQASASSSVHSDLSLPHLTPSIVSYNNLMEIYANQAPYQYGAAGKAEDCLLHVTRRGEEMQGREEVARPNTSSFNRVLKAWGSTGETNGADRALTVLQLMLGLQEEYPEVTPDSFSFVTVITAFKNRGKLEQAESVYQMAFDHYNAATNEDFQPDAKSQENLTVCLNAAISAWASSEQLEAPDRILALLDHAASGGIQGDAKSHKGFVNSILYCAHDLPRADEYLRSLIDASCTRLDSASFHAVLIAWKHSGGDDAATKALSLLQKMIELDTQGHSHCAPNTKTFIYCVDAFSAQKDVPSAIRVLDLLGLAEKQRKVSFYLYQSVLNALRGHKHLAFKCAEVVFRMEEASRLGLVNVKSPILHTLAIEALAKTKSEAGAEEALKVLDCMTVSPSRLTYQGILEAVRYSQRRCLSVTWTIFRDASSGPGLSTELCGTILENFSRIGGLGSAEKAYTVFRHMLDMSLKTGKLSPDSFCMDACLVTMCRSGEDTTVLKAVALAEEMCSMRRNDLTAQVPSRHVLKFLADTASKCGLTRQVEIVRSIMDEQERIIL